MFVLWEGICANPPHTEILLFLVWSCIFYRRWKFYFNWKDLKLTNKTFCTKLNTLFRIDETYFKTTTSIQYRSPQGHFFLLKIKVTPAPSVIFLQADKGEILLALKRHWNCIEIFVVGRRIEMLDKQKILSLPPEEMEKHGFLTRSADGKFVCPNYKRKTWQIHTKMLILMKNKRYRLIMWQ